MKRIVCILVLLALLLTGCGPNALNIDDSEFRPSATAMIDGLLEGNYEVCRAVMTSQVDDTSLRAAVEQMSGLLSKVESYSLTPVGWNKKITNGTEMSALRYEMSTEAGDFYVELVLVEGVDGLAGFHITPIETVTITGAPGAMKGADALQWLVLLFGFAEYGFVLWMAVDCLRRKPKARVGWLLLILLVSSIFTLTLSAGRLSFNFNFGIYLHLSGLLRDSVGAIQLKLYVPLGAIVYWFRRKKLGSPVAAETAPMMEVQEEKSPEIQENPENA